MPHHLPPVPPCNSSKTTIVKEGDENLPLAEGETVFKSFTCFQKGLNLIPTTHKYEKILDDEVEVKVDWCGVCHTDLAFAIRNGLGIGTYPHTPGHEVIGHIVKVGAKVNPKRIGQRVGVGFFKRSCHEKTCELCEQGDDNLCPKAEPVLASNGAHGGFGEIVRCEDKWAVPVPDALDSASAAPLLCGGCTVWSPVDRFELKNKKIGLMGLGGLGHLFLKFCKVLDNEMWVFSHSKEEKEEDAKTKYGVKEVIDVQDSKRLEEMKGTLDFILVTSYENFNWSPFINVLKAGGTLCFVGWCHLPITVGPYELIWEQRHIVGSNVSSSGGIKKMFDFCVKHGITADVEEHPMQEINGVLNKFIKQGFKYRAVLKAGPIECEENPELPGLLDAMTTATGEWTAHMGQTAVETAKSVPGALKGMAQSVATRTIETAQMAKQLMMGDKSGVKNKEDLDLKDGEVAFQSFTAFGPHTSLVPSWHKRPALKPDEVDIKVDYCGLCHTDIAVAFRNAFGNTKYPCAPGHEVVGKIVSIGSNVDKKRIGERVGLGFITRSCRNCEFCDAGDDHLCPDTEQVMGINGAFGGMSDLVRCEDKWAIPIPEKLDSAEAAPLLCAGCTVWSPIDRFELKKKKVALMGLGGLGHLFLKFCKALDNELWVFSHSKEEKEEDAKRLGAKEIIDIHDVKRKEEMLEKFDFMAVTYYQDMDWAPYIDMLKPGGIMCFLGLIHLPVPIGVYPLLWKQRSVVGSCFASTKQIKDMLAFCEKHNITSDIEKHPMQEINGVVNKFIKEGFHYRAVLAAPEGEFQQGTGEGYPTNTETMMSAAKDKAMDRAASAAEVIKGLPETMKGVAEATADTAKQVGSFVQQVVKPERSL